MATSGFKKLYQVLSEKLLKKIQQSFHRVTENKEKATKRKTSSTLIKVQWYIKHFLHNKDFYNVMP